MEEEFVVRVWGCFAVEDLACSLSQDLRQIRHLTSLVESKRQDWDDLEICQRGAENISAEQRLIPQVGGLERDQSGDLKGRREKEPKVSWLGLGRRTQRVSLHWESWIAMAAPESNSWRLKKEQPIFIHFPLISRKRLFLWGQPDSVRFRAVRKNQLRHFLQSLRLRIHGR